MSRRESTLLIIVLVAVLATAALAGYKKLYLPRICGARAAVNKTAVAELVSELQSPNACIRSAAAFDLQKTGKGGEPAIPYLLKTADDRDDAVRWRSIAALGHIGIIRPEIGAAALRHLKDPNQTAVYNSIFALKDYPSHETVAGLMSVLNHTWENVRFRAAQDIPWLLNKERDNDLLPELTKRLQTLQSDPSARVRSRAAMSLAQLQKGGATLAESRSVATGELEKQALVSEFDSLVSTRQFNLIRAKAVAKPKRSLVLAAQYEELEKGIAVLKKDPTGTAATAFLCWVQDGLDAFRFRSEVFKEDFTELKALLSKANSQNPCTSAADKVINDILSGNPYTHLSFECPRVR